MLAREVRTGLLRWTVLQPASVLTTIRWHKSNREQLAERYRANKINQDVEMANHPLAAGSGPFHGETYRECPIANPLPSPDPTSGC
ncbi:MAG: hypothetical protein M3Z95_07575 [Actinomycetota bacterium]|nr:hypothetical protein [Actinomycetota bacterium]